MNDIKYNKGKGGRGRALAGKDHISGLVAFMSNLSLPAGFTATDRNKKILSLADAVALGITPTGGQGEAIEVIDLYLSIRDAFNANKGVILFVGIFDETHDLYSTILVQRFAEGEVRQMGVIATTLAFNVSQIAVLQSACDTMEAEHQPFSVLYSADFSGVEIAGLTSLRTLLNKNVSVVIACDGIEGALQKSLNDFLPSAVGLFIGATSAAKVNENLGWVAKFDLSKNPDNRFDVPAIAVGAQMSLIKNLSAGQIQTLNDFGYVFLLKHIGIAGTYVNDTHTAVSESSDYAYLENNRTIDKAVRNTRAFLLPDLNAPLYVLQDGTLTEDTILSFKNDTERALEQMQKDGEISAFEVTINPLQDVLSSSKLAINLKIVPVGVARNIEVNIGFAVKISK
jgi:hypothetical protein